MPLAIRPLEGMEAAVVGIALAALKELPVLYRYSAPEGKFVNSMEASLFDVVPGT